MPDEAKPDQPGPENPADRMIREVGAKQERMLRAREGDSGFWSSLQVLGVVGWSVALPTLLGIALGVFLDRRWPMRVSWTLTLLFAGLMFGCINAWLHLGGKEQGKRR
jgi:ATP synthase protein I